MRQIVLNCCALNTIYVKQTIVYCSGGIVAASSQYTRALIDLLAPSKTVVLYHTRKSRYLIGRFSFGVFSHYSSLVTLAGESGTGPRPNKSEPERAPANVPRQPPRGVPACRTRRELLHAR